MLDRYAVLGNPVEHSKSPQIHSLFARQTGEQVDYQAIKLEVENFDSFVGAFFEEGGAGLNITVPFKELAFELAVNKSVRATLAGAVNTLLLDEQGKLFGENTDGPGLVRDIQNNYQFQIKGKKILVLGAGGAARGALAALIEEEPDSICIVNRTLSRADQIVEDFKEFADITASDYEGFSEEGFDLIINGTSMSLAGELPPIQGSVLSEKCCCYDMMYADTDTPFVLWAKEQGAALAIDGLGMLVEQAAESFWLWRGVRPGTAPVIAALRA